MAPEDRVLVPTPGQLRGISHPVRMKLLGLLRIDGPQTSAELARATGLNTGATSYHLRQLAAHGFIEDAPGLGQGRERYWRAAHGSTRTVDAPSDEPERLGPVRPSDPDEDVLAMAAYQQAILTQSVAELQDAVSEWTELPPAWRRASTLSDYPMRLTADEAHELLDRLHDVIAEHQQRYPHDRPRPDGSTSQDRELFTVRLFAHALPGRIPHRDGTEPDA